MKRLIIIHLILFSFTPILYAGKIPHPWTECGVGGWMSDFTGLKSSSDWWAISTNVTWDLGITGTTSSTLTPESCYNANVLKYTHDSYDLMRLLLSNEPINKSSLNSIFFKPLYVKYSILPSRFKSKSKLSIFLKFSPLNSALPEIFKSLRET